MQIFYTILYQPLFNLLVWLYDVLPGGDIGVAIIVLTIIIKVILLPLTIKSMKSQKALQGLQPKIDALKKEYGDKKDEMAKAMMALYSKEKVSPFSSCLPMLVQLPILFALYRVLRDGLDSVGLETWLYPFVANPGFIDPVFIGLVDLSSRSIPLAVAAGIVQFFQARMLMGKKPPKEVEGKKGAKDEGMMASMNRSMLYFMPVMTVVIGSSLPGGLALYWLAVNLITVLMQFIFLRKKGDEQAGGGPIMPVM